jgi:mono/diheme cytochrome c family protein
MKKTIVLSLAIINMMGACKSGAKQAETAQAKVVCETTPTYESDIKGVIATYCTKCHGEKAKGGYNFLLLPDLKRAGKNGDLVGVIKWKRGYPKMPAHADKLDDKTIHLIECWVMGGMN